MVQISVQLNYLGVPLNNEQMDAIYNDENKQDIEAIKGILDSFFGLDVKTLPRDVLERYIELSSSENYHPIVPYTETLINRLFSPLKSAKKCYSLKEYTAAIELCAHVGEMLTQLIWEMTPINFNSTAINNEFEKSVLGSKFSKLGQQRRISVLKGFSLLTQDQVEKFDFIRTKRTSYFHLWSVDFSKIKQDSCTCYLKIMDLVKTILQISISSNNVGKIEMNPLLLKYLEKHGEKF